MQNPVKRFFRALGRGIRNIARTIKDNPTEASGVLIAIATLITSLLGAQD